MASRRIFKSSVNWGAIAERVADSPQKAAFLAFKAKCDANFQRVAALPEEPPKIDWSFYKSKLSPELVDSFQKQYEALKIPYPEDKYTSQIDKKGQEALEKIEKSVQHFKLGISRAIESKQVWMVMPPPETMSIGEFVEWFPTILPDPINRPTFWPHTEEFQLTEEDEEEWRQKIAGKIAH